MQPDAGRLLQPEQHGDGGVPDHAVVVCIRPRIRARVALAAVPVLALDRVHECLIVRMDHQREPGGLDRLHSLVELAVLVKADAGHVRI